MNRRLRASLVALMLAGFTGAAFAQSGVSVPLQRGVSVQLPVTSNAVSVPKADKEDALVVTVRHDGSVYLGVNPIRTTELPAKLKTALSDRAEKTVYIKADARTPYASVVKVMDSLRTIGVEGVTLLTAQQDAEEPGSMVPPKGLEMQVVAPRPARRSANLY